MDLNARQFRKQAEQENRGRPRMGRRYSAGLRRLAVSYWEAQRRQGAGLLEVAKELGVAEWSLKRWVKVSRLGEGFRPVELRGAGEPTRSEQTLVVVTPEGFRIEGLDVEGVGRLLRVLR